MHTADTTDGKVTNRSRLSTESEKVHRFPAPPTSVTSGLGHSRRIALFKLLLVRVSGGNSDLEAIVTTKRQITITHIY